MTPIESGVFDGDPAADRVDMTAARTQMIASQALLAGVPEDLALGVVWVESRFHPRARSQVGAQGLMQLMPATYNELAKRLGLGADAFNERDNVRAGLAFLAALHKRWKDKGSAAMCYAVASYYAGADNVRKHGVSHYNDYVRAVMYQRDRFMVALVRQAPGVALPTFAGPHWYDATCHTLARKGKSSSGSQPSPTPKPSPAPRPQPSPTPAGAGVGVLVLAAVIGVAIGARPARRRRRFA